MVQKVALHDHQRLECIAAPQDLPGRGTGTGFRGAHSSRVDLAHPEGSLQDIAVEPDSLVAGSEGPGRAPEDKTPEHAVERISDMEVELRMPNSMFSLGK